MNADSLHYIRQDAEDAQREQSERAKKSLYDFGSGIEWPWEDVTNVFGEIQRGTVHVTAGPSGNGKTTLAVSAALEWIARAVTVVYGGFERSTEDQRRYFAAASLGLHPGRVLSGRWTKDPNFRQMLDAVDRVVTEMAEGVPPWDKLHFVEDDTVTLSAIASMGAIAEAYADTGNGSLCIVDHVDHGVGNYQNSVDVTYAIHRHAKERKTRWWVFSQINNRELNKTGTDLSRHRPMPVSAIKGGQHKEEVAWTVSCLYQPLRLGVTPDEIKAVTNGVADLQTVLWQGVSCLALLKDRDMGGAGRRVLLGWENGRITDAPESVKRALEAQTHGIKTNRSL